jgi:hypothetical protein
MMSELENANEIVISSTLTTTKENIVKRKTIVYETLVDPAVIRIAGEKNKNRLFSKLAFSFNKPDDVEFVSIEKYYEPYIVVSGTYLLDYYRKCNYQVRVDKNVKEVILLNETFLPKQNLYSSNSEQSIQLEGEERLLKEAKLYLGLNKHGQELKLDNIPSAPSEQNLEKVLRSFIMTEIPQNLDVDAFHRRIGERPRDIYRIVSENIDIIERLVIYAPRFKLKYANQKIGKEAFIEFDGVTAKFINQNPSIVSATVNAITVNMKHLFEAVKKVLNPIKTRLTNNS